MSVAGAQAQAKTFANQNRVHSDVEDVRDALEDLGSSVGDMASRQYERAYGAVDDIVQDTGNAVRRNPLIAIGIGLGVGFLFGLVTGGRSGPTPRHSS